MTITHEERMQKKKTVIDSKIADAQEERGVLVINTGNGAGNHAKRRRGLALAVAGVDDEQ